MTMHVDADRHGHLLVVGYCAQGNTRPATLMSPCDQCDQKCGDKRSYQPVAWNSQIVQDYRACRNRQLNAAWNAGERELSHAAHDGANAQRDHEQSYRSLSDQML